MLIWINLYLILYFYLMLSLHIILRKVIVGEFSGRSIVFAHYYIIKFSKFKNLYYCLLLALAGLPPFLFFFIKSNFIIGVIGSVNFFCSFLIFLSFFFNMLFYTQLFIKKNYIFDEMEFLDHRTEPYNYKTINNIILVLVVTTFGIVLAPDLFFITNLFFS